MERAYIIKDMTDEAAKTWSLCLDDDPPIYFSDLRTMAEFLKDLCDRGEEAL